MKVSHNQKKCEQKRAGKVRLIALFDRKATINQHYFLVGTWVNNDYYILVLDQLCIHIRRKCLELVGCWILIQDYACPYVTRLVLKYTARQKSSRTW